MRQKRKERPMVGQADIFGTIHHLDRLVSPPTVIESEGLKVIHFEITQEDRLVPGYLETVKELARRLEPEVKSLGKPPWMTAEWQAKRRKLKQGVL